MPKASPSRHNFNGGVFSPLMYGRVDHDRYQFGMRTLHNFVAAAQGPAIARSGTTLKNRTVAQDQNSALIPFIFSDSQTLMLEFGQATMRIHTDAGVLTDFGPHSVTVIQANPLIIQSATLFTTIVVGDYLVLNGFNGSDNVNGYIAKVTALPTANQMTLDCDTYKGPLGASPGTAARVFKLTTPYGHAHVRNIRWVQDMDVMYLFCRAGDQAAGYTPQKLSRLDATNWEIVDLPFIDGPYLPEPSLSENPARITPSGTGAATPNHTTNSLPAGTGVASASVNSVDAWKAFSRDPDNFWVGGVQSGTLAYEFDVNTVIEGYVIYNMPQTDTGSGNAITPTDRRPKSWFIEGSNNGSAWTIIDEQRDFALWTNNRTPYIEMRNNVAYKHYRLRIISLESGGNFAPWIQKWVLRSDNPPAVTLTASSLRGINNRKGFQTSDVGRFIRLYQGDGHWHSCKIVSRTSTTVVDVQPHKEPLYGTRPCFRWRLGAFSTNTGFPTNASFGFDRLWMTGVRDFPTEVYASTPGNYEDMSPSEASGAVTSANGISARPRVRNAAPIGWMHFTGRGMALGYGSGEYVISSARDADEFSARNMKVSPAASRGSARIANVAVDDQILFVAKDKQTVRELAYVFQADGYKAPSMQVFSQHLGARQFEQMVFQQHPYSIVWCRMADGSLCGLTYNREENVIGWHTHAIAKGNFDNVYVDHMAVKPTDDGTSDELWLVVRRVKTGTTLRTIEKLEPFWTFNQSIDDAYFVDCGLKGTLSPASATITNAWHLEGQAVVGVADGVAFGFEVPVVVTNGQFTIPDPATKVAYGLNFDAYGETTDIAAGAADGTSKGKIGRIHNVSLEVWDTAPQHEVGVFIEDPGENQPNYVYTQIGEQQDHGKTKLLTKILPPVLPDQSYETRRSLAFRRTRPYPFNIIGMYPQLNVSDR